MNNNKCSCADCNPETGRWASSVEWVGATRLEAYNAIDRERDYQDQKFGTERNPSTGEFLVYLQSYVSDAVFDLTHEPGDKTALGTIRKIAALAVACMEQNGVVER